MKAILKNDLRSCLSYDPETKRWYLTCQPDMLPFKDVPVLTHSRWVYDGCGYWRCAVCMERTKTSGSWDTPAHHYCPSCGSTMDAQRHSCMDCIHKKPEGSAVCAMCRFTDKWEKDPGVSLKIEEV